MHVFERTLREIAVIDVPPNVGRTESGRATQVSRATCDVRRRDVDGDGGGGEAPASDGPGPRFYAPLVIARRAGCRRAFGCAHIASPAATSSHARRAGQLSGTLFTFSRTARLDALGDTSDDTMIHRSRTILRGRGPRRSTAHVEPPVGARRAPSVANVDAPNEAERGKIRCLALFTSGERI